MYNVAPYLRECLDSVLAQTFAEWEAVCVDDGSTDGSGAILDEYAAKDKRFRVIHQQNAGVSMSRNVGLGVAYGEWVWFVDGDDSIRQNSLRMIRVSIGNNRKVDVVKIKVSRNPFKGPVLGEEDRPSLPQRICRCADTFWLYRCGVYHSIMKKEKIIDLQFVPKMAMGEDTLYHILAYYRFKTEIVIGAPLYYYRDRDGSATKHMHTLRMVRDWIGLQLRLVRILRDNKEVLNNEMAEFLKWNSSYVFYTSGMSLFKLTSKEMRNCLGSWIKLVKMAGELYRHTFWKRPIISFLALTRSPMWARLLIAIPAKFRRL